MDNLALGCLTGQARVIVWTMNAMVPSVFGNFLEGTMIISFRQLSKASSRDYDHLNCFAKELNMQAWPILEGNKRDYPRGASVNCVLIVMHLIFG